MIKSENDTAEVTNGTDLKEEYCALCVSSGLALLGAGGVGYGSTSRKKGETNSNRNLALILGIVSIIVSGLFYIKYRKECATNNGSSECSE